MFVSFASLRNPLALLAGAALAGLSAARADDLVGAPLDISASVHEALLPGGTLFYDAHALSGVAPSPKQSVDYLYFPAKGENLSGRSTQITGAFASATADSEGNGGVGVTSWIGGSPSNANPDAVEQLVAQAIWKQSFTYLGTPTVALSLKLHIPQIEVGLIGVPPFTTFPTATETARAVVDLTSTIQHADGTTSAGGGFQFGLGVHEEQFDLGPGSFANRFAPDFVGLSPKTADLFGSLDIHDDPFNPRIFLDSVTTSVSIGTLARGDTVSYVYRITAEGATHGGEQGFMAFLGDPFSLDLAGGNLSPTLSAAAPEPATWAMMLIGMAGLFGASRRLAARRA